jgi:hypothetical protein
MDEGVVKLILRQKFAAVTAGTFNMARLSEFVFELKRRPTGRLCYGTGARLILVFASFSRS